MKQWLYSLLISAAIVAQKIRVCFAEKDSQTGSFHLYPVKWSYCGKSYCDLQMLEGLPHLMGSCLRINMKRFKEFQKSSRRLTYLYLFFIIVCNSWDTEFNPGPASLSSSHFPCGVCEASVGWDDRAIVCDTCNKWYHIDCQGVNSNMYSFYNQSLDRSLAWECLNCGMPNFSTSLFDTLGLIDTSNRFDSLSIPDSPIPTELGTPTATSSPVGLQPVKPKTGNKKSVLYHPLRILIMNCQSIKNKKPELQTIVHTAKPNIIFGCESWLSPDIANSEIFPDGYDAIRKDRVRDAHGGVFVCFKKDLVCFEVPELETDCELVWVKLQIVGCKTLYLGSFYRPPDITDPEYLVQLNSSLGRIMSYKNSQVLLGGDFNCGDIDWSR